MQSIYPCPSGVLSMSIAAGPWQGHEVGFYVLPTNERRSNDMFIRLAAFLFNKSRPLLAMLGVPRIAENPRRGVCNLFS